MKKKYQARNTNVIYTSKEVQRKRREKDKEAARLNGLGKQKKENRKRMQVKLENEGKIKGQK